MSARTSPIRARSRSHAKPRSGVPAIALSRSKEATSLEGDALAWLARLLGGLWERRNGWAGDGHFLAMNLPVQLPAPVRRVRIGRDKIAARAEIVSRSGDSVVLTLPSGRVGTPVPGDENAALAAGGATLCRLRWDAQAALDDTLSRTLPPQL